MIHDTLSLACQFSCMRQKSGMHSACASSTDKYFFLPLCWVWHPQTESLAVTFPKRRENTWLQASLPYAYIQIQFRNTALDRRIWSNTNTLCFLWLFYYRWQTYSSLYSSIWPGDHGYPSIPPQKEIKYSHFENCSTNAFPKTSVIALVLLSYLGIHSPFLIFPFALFQHLPNHSFYIYRLRGSEMLKVTTYWASCEESAWDPTACQEETLLFSGARWVICKLNQKE